MLADGIFGGIWPVPTGCGGYPRVCKKISSRPGPVPAGTRTRDQRRVAPPVTITTAELHAGVYFPLLPLNTHPDNSVLITAHRSTRTSGGRKVNPAAIQYMGTVRFGLASCIQKLGHFLFVLSFKFYLREPRISRPHSVNEDPRARLHLLKMEEHRSHVRFGIGWSQNADDSEDTCWSLCGLMSILVRVAGLNPHRSTPMRIPVLVESRFTKRETPNPCSIRDWVYFDAFPAHSRSTLVERAIQSGFNSIQRRAFTDPEIGWSSTHFLFRACLFHMGPKISGSFAYRGGAYSHSTTKIQRNPLLKGARRPSRVITHNLQSRDPAGVLGWGAV
ncbi:hypothetical protein FB45DRAFT_1080516 [Roridomyces roridus]|uniref:Uncharacterized protein n=1 Tax=Roridomyces roridus TaxID=1738132 RepID=A0AAD7BS13_9AGAR|nr:hypothetical protein FB45DRAFT_1080516 [Roridomyces roridus]